MVELRDQFATDVAPSRAPEGLRAIVKQWLHSVPFAARLARHLYFGVLARRFGGSADYWDARYRKGRDSGPGSYGQLAWFKAEVLNRFVSDNGIKTIIEFGCGDGAQLSLARYPDYHGTDVSPAAIARCRARFCGDQAKSFSLAGAGSTAPYDLALSLDVIYHLVEYPVFDTYMRELFAASRRYVIVYSSNDEIAVPEPHICHRRFTDWVAANEPRWRLRETIANRYPFDARDPDNTSFADFYIFEKS
jgi:Methyltransferase domain